MQGSREKRMAWRASRWSAVALVFIFAASMSARAQTDTIILSGGNYHVGCNGTPIVSVPPTIREDELVHVVLEWKADSTTIDWTLVRVVLEPEDAGTASRVTMGNLDVDAADRSLEGVVGDLPAGQTGESHHYLTWTSGTTCNGGAQSLKFKATVYYEDDDSSPDDPYIYDTSDYDELEFTLCSNSAIGSATDWPPEVCQLEVSTVGAGVRFKWGHMTDVDRYNLYRGFIAIGTDDTSSAHGGPRTAYTHTAEPTSSRGFCGITGLDSSGNPYSGSITCTCTDCDDETDTDHREYTDLLEPGPTSPWIGYYYLISAEHDCLTTGVGVEGTLGFDSLGNERPHGGGDCAPLGG